MSRSMTNRTQTMSMTTTPDQGVGVYESEGRGIGWLLFAGTMLGIAGIMRIFDSVWAFGYSGALPEGLKDTVIGSNLTTYAWLWLGVGSLLLVSSFLVVVGSQFGRWVGIVAASIASVTAIFWMPYYPVWSLVYIGLSIMVIYALAVYGGRVPE
jgi:hypothetical protein